MMDSASPTKAVTKEACQVASNVFGLSHAVVHCNESTTLEDFSDSILVEAAGGEICHGDSSHNVDNVCLLNLQPGIACH